MISEPRDGLVIGVDVGGTKVAAGFVDATGKIASQVRTPMLAHGDAATGLDAVKSAIDAPGRVASHKPV